MRISKEQYDRELQPMYGVGRAITWLLSRRWGVQLANLGARPLWGLKAKGIVSEQRWVDSPSTPGHRIRVRLFRPAGVEGPLPAMLYLHGGGYMLGLPEGHLDFVADVLARRDVVVVAPAYRLSLQHPFPAGFDDCWDTLTWMKGSADELGIRPDRFVVAGHSAGGGLTAALTLKARDTGEADVALQMPLYPMIDHRQQTASAPMEGAPVWDARTNAFAWAAYLAGLQGEVPAYASPALESNLAGLPPTISFVASLEPFRDETVAYLGSLEAAGVPTRFRVFEGGFHAFEIFAPTSTLGREARRFLWEAFEGLFDEYVG